MIRAYVPAYQVLLLKPLDYFIRVMMGTWCCVVMPRFCKSVTILLLFVLQSVHEHQQQQRHSSSSATAAVY